MLSEKQFKERVEEIRISYSPILMHGWKYYPHEEKFAQRMETMKANIFELEAEVNDKQKEQEFQDAKQRILEYVESHNNMDLDEE